MNTQGKQKLMESLRLRAGEIREWLYGHTSPDTQVSEFEKKTNEYAILCMRIYIIDKQW